MTRVYAAFTEDAAGNQKAQSDLAGKLLRHALLLDYGLLPEDVKLWKNERGKPFLAGETGLFISLAHTAGAVCAAVGTASVGVDIERIRPFPAKVAKRFFPEPEAAAIRLAANPDEAFIRLWTKKEARAKAADKPLIAVLKENMDGFSNFFWQRRLGSFVCCLWCEDPAKARFDIVTLDNMVQG